MTDYISREEAIKAIVNLTSYHTAPEINTYVEAAHYREGTWIGGVRDALIEIGNLPAADVQPVIRGEWVYDCDRVMADGWTYKQRHCSVCGWQTVECVNYCQNCGADMRKEET